MYLTEIELENIGPINYIKRQLPFFPDGNPKPVVLIGQNGTGKSIFLSHIVNALIAVKQNFYEDNEIEEGKVFKYRSPVYIKSGKSYSRSKVIFEQDFFLSEWQLNRIKKDFKEKPEHEEWSKINENETSLFDNNFGNSLRGLSFGEINYKLKSLIDNNCILYFPPNRFEEPGWLNYDNLMNKADYRFLKRISNYSNRLIINYSPLKDNQNWLLDLLFDKYVLEMQTIKSPVVVNNDSLPINFEVPLFLGFQGESSNIYNEIINFLKLLFQTTDPIRFGIGKRRSRDISILKNELQWISNLFTLSTGETILLNIFLTIIKDFDLSNAKFTSLSEIRGIVIVDEADIHLHCNHQYVVLPQLLKLFPKVQFILTSHSPLFLLGLKKELGENNFEILNLPDGKEVDIESFSEFEKAYTYFKETEKYTEDIKTQIEKSHKDILFVEGDYDIKYLQKAAELLEKKEVLENFELFDGEGFGNLDKVYKHFNTKLAEIIPQKIVLLFDCDTNKEETNKGKIFKRVIPIISDNPIQKGIENMFKKPLIDKAMEYKSVFVDITLEHSKKIKGEEKIIPVLWEVNKDEKRNLCDWIINNANKEDFNNFNSIFDLLSEIINFKK